MCDFGGFGFFFFFLICSWLILDGLVLVGVIMHGRVPHGCVVWGGWIAFASKMRIFFPGCYFSILDGMQVIILCLNSCFFVPILIFVCAVMNEQLPGLVDLIIQISFF